jgi:hypothetical protein
MPVTRRWSGRAHLTWASSQFLFLAYLVFILQWTVSSGLSWPGVLGGLLLCAFEVIAGLMAAAYLWELCDADTDTHDHWADRDSVAVDPALADPGADRPTLHAERSRSQPVAVLRSCNRKGART